MLRLKWPIQALDAPYTLRLTESAASRSFVMVNDRGRQGQTTRPPTAPPALIKNPWYREGPCIQVS
jgi:hypothetical protein